MSAHTDQYDLQIEKLDNIVRKTMKKEDDAIKVLFGIQGEMKSGTTRKQSEKEEIRPHLPLSERHYLIMAGEIRSQQQTKVTSSSLGEFPDLMERLVRGIISEFKEIKISDRIREIEGKESNSYKDFDEKLSAGKNFLFHIIRKRNGVGPYKNAKKSLRVYLSISGSGRRGKKWHSVHHQTCEDKLKKAIDDHKLDDYDIKGTFVPFSRREERAIGQEPDDFFEETREILSEENDGFIKMSFIAKILQGYIENNYHTRLTLLKNIDNDAIFLANFNKAHELSGELKSSVEEVKEQIGGSYDPTRLIELISLDLMKEIEQKPSFSSTIFPAANETSGSEEVQSSPASDSSEASSASSSEGDQIRRNIRFLKKQSYLIHFKEREYEAVMKKLLNNEHIKDKIARYKESLRMVWVRSRNIDIFDLIKYQARCSEDNLIDYLTINSHVLRKKGIHYLFSVQNQSDASSEGAVRIRAPCRYCSILFPLQFAAIAGKKAGLLMFLFKERSEGILDLDKFSIHDKISYLRRCYAKINVKELDESELSLKTLTGKDPIPWMRIFSSSSQPIPKHLDLRGRIEIIARRAASFGDTDALGLILSKNTSKKSGLHDKLLIAAIEHNNFKTIKWLFNDERRNPELIVRGRKRLELVLHQSAVNKRADIFEFLAKKLLADREIDETCFWKILGGAIKSSSVEMVREIWKLRNGRQMNPAELRYRISSIESACCRGDYEIVKFLLDNNFSPKKLWHYFPKTPLNFAVTGPYNTDVGNLLFEIMDKTDRNTFIDFRAPNGFTALHFMSLLGHNSMICSILSNLRPKQTARALCDCGKRRVGESEHSSPLTPMSVAVLSSHQEVVEKLLDIARGLKIKTRSELIKKIVHPPEGNWRPIHFAALIGHEGIFRILLKEGADIEVVSGNGRTPLHCAAMAGGEDIIKILLQKGVNLSVRDSNGCTALHLAAANGCTSVIRVLLSHVKESEIKNFVDDEIADGLRATSLHAAAVNGHADVVAFLIECGANVDARDHCDWTPLHMASKEGYKGCVKILLDKGANIQAKTTEGETPLLIARRQDDKEIIDVMMDYVWKDINL